MRTAHGETPFDAHYESLFAQFPQGMARLDLQGLVLDVNQALIDRSGFSREQLVGRNFLDFISADSQKSAGELAAGLEAGRTTIAELRLMHAGKTPVPRRITIVPGFANGRLSGGYLVIQDISEHVQAEELLEDSEQRFRSLFDQNPDGVVALDLDGTLVDINDAALALGSNKREEVIGLNYRTFLKDEQLERMERYFKRVLAGEVVNYELTYEMVNASDRRVLEVTSFPKIKSHKIVGMYSIMQDITARREAERRADAQAKRIHELYLVAATPNISDTQIVLMLETCCRLLEMEVAAIVDCTRDPEIAHRFDTVEAGADGHEAIIALAMEAAGSHAPVTVTAATHLQAKYRAGIAVPVNVAGQPFGALCFARTTDGLAGVDETDIDLAALMSALLGSALERRRSRANLRTLAYFDSLTGLPNRVFLQERLRDAIEAAQSNMRRVAIVFFDLDRFKDVNDTVGHALGDRLLQLVAGRLVETVRDRGLVARMGGDEFVVLLASCDSVEEIRQTAEELLDVIDDPYYLDEYEQFVTASAGIAIYPDDGKDDHALIKNADIAMYRAKDLGRNAYQVYAPSLEATIQMRLSQEKLLRRALENQEFVVHYQPQVDMSTGKIVAVEALVRWNNPKTGIIFPARFIPSAEMSGLIVPLGEWVLQTAAAQTKQWHVEHPGLRIAVNLSAKQFHQPDLRSRILKALQASGLKAGSLELEITESVAMTDAAASIQIMRELVDSGVRIGLDDFGTGYSSLSYLRRFPAAVLKIDRSFVGGIGVEGNDETIVITVIAMAHNLGLEVVAEGVETAEQYAFLHTYACDRVQGYYVSPAVAASGIDELMREWRPNAT